MQTTQVININGYRLKSDYIRIEIVLLVFVLRRLYWLKSDYIRIEIRCCCWCCMEFIKLKSDYIRIEIYQFD